MVKIPILKKRSSYMKEKIDRIEGTFKLIIDLLKDAEKSIKELANGN